MEVRPRARILHVISGLGRGGAEATLVKLCVATAQEFEHVVISLGKTVVHADSLRRHNIDVICLGMDARLPSMWRIGHLAKEIRRLKPQLIQTWMYHADFLGGLCAYAFSRAPVIWGVHHSLVSREGLGSSTFAIAKFCAKVSAHVPALAVYCAQAARDAHEALGYTCEGVIIRNGYDTARFQPPSTQQRHMARVALGLSPEDFVVGCVARWHPIKDHGSLLRAAAGARKKYPRVRLLLAGLGCDSSNKHLISTADALGLSSALVAAGEIGSPETIYHACDVHALASLGEALPNVVAESMACGIPPIGTAVGDVPTLIGECGWTVPPGASDELQKAIEAAYLDSASDSIADRGMRSRQRILDHFSLPVMVRNYIDIWRNTINRATVR